MRQPEISSLAPLASKGSRRSMLREGKGGFYRARSMGSSEKHAKLAVNNRARSVAVPDRGKVELAIEFSVAYALRMDDRRIHVQVR